MMVEIFYHYTGVEISSSVYSGRADSLSNPGQIPHSQM